MTVNERLNDISEISGFSVDIVRKVQQAELESILKSLKQGERATLIGRCTIEPSIGSKMAYGGEGLQNYLRATAKVSHRIKQELEELSCFEERDGNSEADKIINSTSIGVATTQIQSLI